MANCIKQTEEKNKSKNKTINIPKNTRILAKDHYVSNNTRQTYLNNNDCIIGPSGSGKTRGYVIPNIMQEKDSSMVIVDTKGNLYTQLSPLLEKRGYKVMLLDFRDPDNSIGYNPFHYIGFDSEKNKYNDVDILSLAGCLHGNESTQEPYWDYAARNLAACICGYVLEVLPKSKHNFHSFIKLFNHIMPGIADELFGELATQNPKSFAVSQYNFFKTVMNAEKTFACVKSILAASISCLGSEDLLELFNKDEKIDFCSLGTEKTALFVNVSDTDRSLDVLFSIFYTQLFHTLCDFADSRSDSRLPIPVRVYLDDFANNVKIENFDKLISTLRSREIYISLILQSITQLDSLYSGDMARTILNNCDHLLYLGGNDQTTADFISVRTNLPVTDILYMPLDKYWLFERGTSPVQVSRFELSDHPNYKEVFSC